MSSLSLERRLHVNYRRADAERWRDDTGSSRALTAVGLQTHWRRRAKTVPSLVRRQQS